MANEQNLIPFDERTESEQREIAQKGGVASGAARRRKRSLKEAADLYLALPIASLKARNKIIAEGIAPEDADNQMAVIFGLTAKAAKGDARAAKVLIDLLEEKQDNNRDASQIEQHNALVDAIKGTK